MRSALTKFVKKSSSGNKYIADVVFPAPFGPPRTKIKGGPAWGGRGVAASLWEAMAEYDTVEVADRRSAAAP